MSSYNQFIVAYVHKSHIWKYKDICIRYIREKGYTSIYLALYYNVNKNDMGKPYNNT